MTNRETYFLAVLKAALHNTPAPPAELAEEDWLALLQLARHHQVLPLFCQAAPLPAGLTDHKPQVRRQVALQAVKTCQFLDIYRALREKGLTPLVVKGILCRSLYPQPDLRPSSDEDLLIPPDQWQDAVALMEALGMEAFGKGTELACRIPGQPLCIELHRHLIDPENRACGHWNSFFQNIWENREEVTVSGATLLAPDPTDHLFYLICHALKHFLHSGFGIRQVCDIALFTAAHGSRIQWHRLAGQCRAIRAEGFTSALLGICRDYLGFDPAAAGCPEAWLAPEPDALPLLEDILRSGIFGNTDPNRLHSSNMTLDAAAGRSGSLLGALFPERQRLISAFPYLERRPWLLPLAWCQRLCGYAREIGRAEGSTPAEAARTGARRVALLRQYGLVP